MKPDEQFFIAERKLIINSAGTSIITEHAYDPDWHIGAREQTRYVIYRSSGTTRVEALWGGMLDSELGTSLRMHLNRVRQYKKPLDSFAFKYVDDAEEYLTNAVIFVRWLNKLIDEANTKKIKKIKARVGIYMLTGEQWDTTDTAKMRALSHGLQGKRREDLPESRRDLEDLRDLA